MPLTALDLAADILVTIGETGQGQSISPEDGTYLLTRINAVLDSWSQEELYIFTRTITPYLLTANQGQYAIGPNAAAPFNTARPTKIDFARILIQIGGVYVGQGGQGDGGGLRLIDAVQFAGHADQSSTSIVPEELYYEPTVPNGILHLFDIPSCPLNTQLELTAWSALPQLVSLASPLVFPPGYYEALVMAVGVAVSPAYNKPVDQVTASRAQTCTQRIKEMNQRILIPGRVPVSQQGAPQQPGQPQAAPPLQ